jgi:magnesium-transporting ATPase (P-type)
MKWIWTGLVVLYGAVFLFWVLFTGYWMMMAIRGRNYINGHTEEKIAKRLHYILPLWRKEGRFSASGFWLWICISVSFLLIFMLPLFPNQVTLAIAGEPMFWTAILGLVSALILNYYFGKRLTQNGPEPLPFTGGSQSQPSVQAEPLPEDLGNAPEDDSNTPSPGQGHP